MRRDLRHTRCDRHADVADGVVYLTGSTMQVWWTRDVFGVPFDPPVSETWTLPEAQVDDSFADFVERMSS